MCGIWARTKFNQSVAPDELVFPVQALSHRGPDGYGWWQDEHAAFVHTRLSIIDLAGGAQPLISFDKRWIGVVNGELYDYSKIRERLIRDGIQFKTASDSEVLLNLYAKEGLKGISQVSGEFAFIFYDRKEKQFHFGRDPIGVKPLFWEMKSDSFTLASEMKALSPEKPQFSKEYINNFVGRLMIPPTTSLENVQHVWPGRVYKLDFATRKISFEQYFQLPLFKERKLTGEEAKEKLDHELKEAVRRRLVADVEVGCYLSGGIDSALVAAIAAHLGAKPKAFTVGFADRDFDESPFAKQIATDLGLEHFVVKLTPQNFMDNLIKSIVAFENPITNPHGAGKNLLSACAAEQVKVVLSGEGADEWFGGYAYLRYRKLALFIEKHPWLKNAVAQLSEREMGVSLKHLDGKSETYAPLAEKYFDGIYPALFGRLAKSRFFNYTTGENLGPRVEKICYDLRSVLNEENPTGKFNEWDLNTWFANRTDLLHYILANVGDRQEMSNSLEGRTPFMDPFVLQTAGQIKEKDLISRLTEKNILREIGKKYLKPEHYQRGKRPFFAPMNLLYLRANRQITSQYIEIARKELPWLNWKNIDHLLSSEKRALRSPLEGAVLALKFILFSTGVLSQHLREFPKLQPRGYRLPLSANDIMSHRQELN